ncbi:MAG: hypothetical protein RLZZ127_2309, partial [Planctomycetota bacterium]
PAHRQVGLLREAADEDRGEEQGEAGAPAEPAGFPGVAVGIPRGGTGGAEPAPAGGQAATPNTDAGGMHDPFVPETVDGLVIVCFCHDYSLTILC